MKLNNSYITGIVSVGFILMSFGVCCVIGSTSVGYLLRWLSRGVVAIGASVMVVSMSVLLLLWEPTEVITLYKYWKFVY